MAIHSCHMERRPPVLVFLPSSPGLQLLGCVRQVSFFVLERGKFDIYGNGGMAAMPDLGIAKKPASGERVTAIPKLGTMEWGRCPVRGGQCPAS